MHDVDVVEVPDHTTDVLATLVALAEHGNPVTGPRLSQRVPDGCGSLAAIQHASEALIRNPNEALLLEDLLFQLA